MEDLARFVRSPRFWMGSVVLLTCLFLSNTVAEFLVSLYNRFDVYPIGTDTNMLARTIVTGWYICLLSTMLAVRFWGVSYLKYWQGEILTLFGLVVSIVDYDSGPLTILFALATLVSSFYSKYVWLAPVLAFLLFVLHSFEVVPSLVPANWCQYELTILPCNLQ